MPFKVEKCEIEENIPADMYKVYEENGKNFIYINIPHDDPEEDIIQVAYDSLDLFSGTVEFSKEFDSVKFITESNTETRNYFSNSIYFRNILLEHLKNNDMELFALESIRFYKCAIESLKIENYFQHL